MFQNVQQFHSGGSNIISFRLLATLFITKNSIDMRILSKGYPFSSFANKCKRSLMLALFHKSIFDIFNRLDIDKKGHKIIASPFGDQY